MSLRVALLSPAEAGGSAAVVGLERACRELRFTAVRVEVRPLAPDATLAELVAEEVDVAIPVGLGRERADAVRWLLDWARIACAGPDARAATVARDEEVARAVLAARGIAVATAGAHLRRFEVALLGSKERLEALPPRALGSVPEYDPRRAHDAACVGLARSAYATLGLAGHGTIEIALASDGTCAVIRADPDPDLDPEATLTSAARRAGIDHATLVRRIVDDALRRAGSIA